MFWIRNLDFKRTSILVFGSRFSTNDEIWSLSKSCLLRIWCPFWCRCDFVIEQIVMFRCRFAFFRPQNSFWRLLKRKIRFPDTYLKFLFIDTRCGPCTTVRYWCSRATNENIDLVEYTCQAKQNYYKPQRRSEHVLFSRFFKKKLTNFETPRAQNLSNFFQKFA